MDIDWKLILSAAQWGFMLIGSFVLWVRSGSNKNAGKIADHDQKIVEIQKRIERAEAVQESMPTPARFSVLEREVSAVGAEIKGVSIQVGLVYEHLLNKEK